MGQRRRTRHPHHLGPIRLARVAGHLPPALRHCGGATEFLDVPGQDIGTGMSRLARALAASPARSLDDLCDSVLASLTPRARDDIALLLARATA